MRYRIGHYTQILVLLFAFVAVVCSCSSSEALMSKQVDSVLYEAETLVAVGDYSGAKEMYENSLSQYPAEPRLSYNYALVLAQIGDYSASLAVMTDLNERTDFAHVTYLKALAGIAAASGDITTAHTYWKKIIELHPLDRESRELLLESLISLEQNEQAYQVAYEAYELHLFDCDLFDMLAQLTKETGRGDGKSWEIIAATCETHTATNPRE